jgi:glutamine amidotransferase
MGDRSRRPAADTQHSGPAVLQAAAAIAARRHYRPVSGTGRTAMSVAIIDYGSGNLHSAAKAFELAARSMQDPQKVMVTRDPEAVYRADRIVLPGVGAFADCRRGLDAVNGMLEAMTEAVRVKARPFFGICVGMQLMATRGKEHVITEGFNWIAGDVEKISPREENLKIPHMGWNTLDMIREHPVLERLPLGPKGRHAYFVHSYHLNASNEADVLARADYGGPVTAIVGKDTAIGTQFHPEKSQRFGLALISNFLKWKP